MTEEKTKTRSSRYHEEIEIEDVEDIPNRNRRTQKEIQQNTTQRLSTLFCVIFNIFIMLRHSY